MLCDAFKPYEEYFILPKATANSDVNWFAFAVTIKDNSPFNRTELVNFFENNKIQTRPYFAGCILLQPAYSGLYNGDVRSRFHNAVKATTNTFFLGVSPVISVEQIEYIKHTLNSFMKDHE